MITTQLALTRTQQQEAAEQCSIAAGTADAKHFSCWSKAALYFCRKIPLFVVQRSSVWLLQNLSIWGFETSLQTFIRKRKTSYISRKSHLFSCSKNSLYIALGWAIPTNFLIQMGALQKFDVFSLRRQKL